MKLYLKISEIDKSISDIFCVRSSFFDIKFSKSIFICFIYFGGRLLLCLKVI